MLVLVFERSTGFTVACLRLEADRFVDGFVWQFSVVVSGNASANCWNHKWRRLNIFQLRFDDVGGLDLVDCRSSPDVAGVHSEVHTFCLAHVADHYDLIRADELPVGVKRERSVFVTGNWIHVVAQRWIVGDRCPFFWIKFAHVDRFVERFKCASRPTDHGLRALCVHDGSGWNGFKFGDLWIRQLEVGHVDTQQLAAIERAVHSGEHVFDTCVTIQCKGFGILHELRAREILQLHFGVRQAGVDNILFTGSGWLEREGHDACWIVDIHQTILFSSQTAQASECDVRVGHLDLVADLQGSCWRHSANAGAADSRVLSECRVIDWNFARFWASVFADALQNKSTRFVSWREQLLLTAERVRSRLFNAEIGVR